MFSVYGTTGQTFRGTLEYLPRVIGVQQARRARGIALEGDELGAEVTLTPQRSGEATDEAAARYAKAASAYARMLHPDVERGPVRHAFQVMGHDVLAVGALDSVAVAWQALAARGVRQAPVLDDALGVVGLFSDRDLLTVLDLAGGTLTGWVHRQVAEVMTTPVVCADPVTDIRRIARVLLDTGLPALPVVNEAGRLAGIVSRGDILRATVADPPLSLWV